MILTVPHLPVPPARIVSLVPSQTELLHYLGLEEETIAITKFCVHPESWFRNKNRIGGTKAIDVEKIISLQPDLVIANKEENVKEQVEAIAKHCPVWLTDVNTFAEACLMISDIGQLTSRIETAEKLVTDIQDAFKLIDAPDEIPALYLIWKDPYMTVGGDTFIHDMLAKAGMKNVFGTKKRYPEISIPQIKASGCSLLLLSSEPYPFSSKHVESLSAQLPGVNVRLADGEMFSWYGSRLLLAARYFKTFASAVIVQ